MIGRINPHGDGGRAARFLWCNAASGLGALAQLPPEQQALAE